MRTRRKYERQNGRFYWLLEQQELTVPMLAALVGTSRPHLTLVLNNTPGRGHFTRRKVAQLIWTPPHPRPGTYVLTEEMLKALGWDREGRIASAGDQENQIGTFHVEQPLHDEPSILTTNKPQDTERMT